MGKRIGSEGLASNACSTHYKPFLKLSTYTKKQMIDLIINIIQAFITFWALFLTGACVTIWALYHSFKSGGKR